MKSYGGWFSNLKSNIPLFLATNASLYIERKSSLLSLLILSTPPTTIPDERGKLGFGLQK